MVSASSLFWSRVPISCKAAKFERTDDWCFSKLGADWDHPPKEVEAGDDGYDGLPQMIWTRSRWWNVLGPHVLPFTPSAGTKIIYIKKYKHTGHRPHKLNWPYLFHYKTPNHKKMHTKSSYKFLITNIYTFSPLNSSITKFFFFF